MTWWHHITALGGLAFTVPVFAAIVLVLALARRWRLLAWWGGAFGVGMALVVASKLAFLGWGIGVREADFIGFSGHASRAAAVFPAAFFMLCQQERRMWLNAGVLFGVACSALIAISRVMVGAHSPSEAALGFALGTVIALVFIGRALREDRVPLPPVVIGACMAVLLLRPESEPVDSEKWLTLTAMQLSGHDRPYVRWSFELARHPYVVRCRPGEIVRGYACS